MNRVIGKAVSARFLSGTTLRQKSSIKLNSSPRTRGDVPTFRGRRQPAFTLHPAHAGMFLREQEREAARETSPRTRGDVPIAICRINSLTGFTPHTRGCSQGRPQRALLWRLHPAHAGMFLVASIPLSSISASPRTRGDVPKDGKRFGIVFSFTPHTRGCSWPLVTSVPKVSLHPAHAGMFLALVHSLHPANAGISTPLMRGFIFLSADTA